MFDCSNLPPHVPELDDQIVGSIVFTGRFGLYYCTETPGLMAMLCVSWFTL